MAAETLLAIENEQQIHQLMENLAEAVRTKDADRLITHYAPDVVAFDVINPLQYTGAGEVKARAEQWLATFEDGLVGYEISDLRVTAGDDTAFCHSLNHIYAMRTDGDKIDMWWRATVCLSKTGEDWLITHIHSSVPFDMETGKASLDLQP
jgi:uncharacterized protein (TIGR02246 family)